MKLHQPAFRINLDRRPDRLASASALLSRLGISYTRISVFDAKAASELRNVDWWRAFVYNNFRPPFLGQVGCYFSHRMIWQKMVDEGFAQVAVFEDDIVEGAFDPQFMDLDVASLGLDLLRLEGIPARFNPSIFHPRQPKPIKTIGRTITFAPSYGTAAYLITLEGARKCLAQERYWFNVDHFDMWTQLTGLRTGQLQPPSFRQSASASDVTGAQIDMDVIRNTRQGPHAPASRGQRLFDLLFLRPKLGRYMHWYLSQGIKLLALRNTGL